MSPQETQIDKLDEIVEQSILYDFYGELLSEHKKRIFEDYVLNDLSLGEIAAEQGISRQGVHDLIKRCDNTLEGYERKLHLVERFNRIKSKVKCIDELTENEKVSHEQLRREIKKLSDEILEAL